MSAPALVLPSLGASGLRGRYRARPEDFVVVERPGWTPTGAGEHLLVEVEKRGANTEWVAGALARLAGIPAADVGFCGAKDRHAVTRQWFSLRDPSAALDLTGARDDGDEWRVLDLARHDRKLRRGDHAANAFELRLGLDAPVAAADLASARTRLERGVPNAFGPQRFGRGASNLAAVADWVGGRRLPRRGPVRARLLGAARAHLFNRVLALRLERDCWEACVDGDVADASGAPTGPLWGRGRPLASGSAAALEADALDGFGAWCEALEHAGPTQERRSLVLRPMNLRLEAEGVDLSLAFELPPGAFATAVLAALGDFRDAAADAASPVEGA